MEDTAVTEEMEKQRQTKHKITILTEEELEKAYTYVELNFGKTYLTPAEEKRMNYLMCRELHRDCSLYFTEGILKNPVKRNYQYEYAVRLKNKKAEHRIPHRPFTKDAGAEKRDAGSTVRQRNDHSVQTLACGQKQ